eukprot:scaffold304_cov409-Prasinococcus_capsulatus_cf.AAC.9
MDRRTRTPRCAGGTLGGKGPLKGEGSVSRHPSVRPSVHPSSLPPRSLGRDCGAARIPSSTGAGAGAPHNRPALPRAAARLSGAGSGQGPRLPRTGCICSPARCARLGTSCCFEDCNMSNRRGFC